MKNVVVYGKTGCGKCELLQRRLERKGVEFELRKVDTEAGLTAFCRAEQLNPSRIPAIVLEDAGRPLRGDSGLFRELFGTSSLHDIAGMQTDYGSGGVLRPDAIDRLLELAV